MTLTSPTGINITWERVPCEDRNVDITGYTVRYHLTSDLSIMVTTEVSIFDKVVTATGLFPRTSYMFMLEAVSTDSTLQPAMLSLAVITVNTSIPEGM